MKHASIKSVQSKIALWTGGCLLLLAMVLIVYAILTQRSAAIQTAEFQAKEQAYHEASVIQAEVEEALDSARTLAQVLAAMKTDSLGLTRSQVNIILRQVLVQNPNFLAVYSLWEPNAFDGRDADYTNMAGHDKTGRFIPYWVRRGGEIKYEPLENYEIPGQGDYYQIPKMTVKESIINPTFRKIEGVDVLIASLVVPIVVDGNFYGITGIDLRLDFLQTTADEVRAIDGSTKLVLYSNNGTIAGLTAQPELVGKPISILEDKGWEEALSNIAQGKEAIQSDGSYLSVLTPIHFGNTNTPWSVNLLIPQSKIYATANAAMWRMIGIGLFMFVASSLLLWKATQQVSNPIKLLTLGAQKLSTGDVVLEGLDWKQIEKIDQGNDEFANISQAFHALIDYFRGMASAGKRIANGDLAIDLQPKGDTDLLGNAFIEMCNNLRALIQQVAENAANLRAASAQLAVAANQAGQATNQISSTIQQVAKGISQQSESINRTAASTEQLSRAIEGVARGAQEQAMAVSKASNITSRISAVIQQVSANAISSAQGASQAAATAQSGAQTVQDTIQGMQSIKAKVGLSAQKVQEMGQRSQQIGAIVETIEDIASQTNLLALNAAIEAARAGEHGKGFAVVADEVRKLAERSAAATKEIGALIQSIQSAVEEAVDAMSDGADEVENGVARASQSGQALNSILAAVQSVSEQVEDIAKAAQQMNAASDELVVSMDSVSAVVEENTAATEQMSTSSTEVTQSIENIASISQENSAAIEEVSTSAEEMTAQVEEVTAAAQSLAEMAEALQHVVARFRLQVVRSPGSHEVDSQEKEEIYIGRDRRRSLSEQINEGIQDNGRKVKNVNE